jgi:hypothetical protein
MRCGHGGSVAVTLGAASNALAASSSPINSRTAAHAARLLRANRRRSCFASRRRASAPDSGRVRGARPTRRAAWWFPTTRSTMSEQLGQPTPRPAGFSDALILVRWRRLRHDPGRVAVDVAVMLADGGQAIVDLAVVRDEAVVRRPGRDHHREGDVPIPLATTIVPPGVAGPPPGSRAADLPGCPRSWPGSAVVSACGRAGRLDVAAPRGLQSHRGVPPPGPACGMAGYISRSHGSPKERRGRDRGVLIRPA